MEGILILQSNMKTVGMILWQKIFLKVSPIVVFNEINDLPLVPGHLNQWFWCNFDPKFGVFGAVSGVWPGSGQSKKSPLLLKKKLFGIGPRSFEPVVLARFWLKIWGVLHCIRDLEWPKWKKSLLLKEINWDWSQVIWTSGFGAILTETLGCFGLFQGIRGPKMQK